VSEINQHVAILRIGKTILNEMKKYPYDKCQVCGHKIVIIDRKYNKPCKPYVLHNWQRKCHCGCINPKAKGV
jgi:DNA-directed RNA polymerase subunit RPC12/RpoP